MKENEPGSAPPRRKTQLFAFGFEAAVGIAALLAAWVFSVPIGPTITLDIESLIASAAGIAALFLVFLVVSRSKAAPFRCIPSCAKTQPDLCMCLQQRDLTDRWGAIMWDTIQGFDGSHSQVQIPKF